MAIRHYKEVLEVPGLDGMPMKKVQVQTNLGDVYSTLGSREQSVKDYERALQYLEAAIPQLQGMSSTRNQAIALLNKGTCLMSLGRLENKENLWFEAKDTYAQAASLFALNQDQMEWANIQRDSGNLEMFISEKKMDIPGLSLCLKFYGQERTVHQKKTMPLLWAQSSVVESLTLSLLGDKTCDPIYWERAKKNLEEVGGLLDPKEQLFTLYENNICLGSLLEMEGTRLGNPIEIGKAVEVYEETLKQLEGTDMIAQRCALQSGLCLALAEQLSLALKEETVQKGKTLL